MASASADSVICRATVSNALNCFSEAYRLHGMAVSHSHIPKHALNQSMGNAMGIKNSQPMRSYPHKAYTTFFRGDKATATRTMFFCGRMR